MKKTLLTLLLLANAVFAIDVHEFDNEQQRLDYQQLTEELRCLVCQNQNIADSDAGLAKDLRNEVAKMVKQGQTQEQITDYLVKRYGDFVRYNPPVRADTIILWVMPLLVLLIAIFMVIRTIKKNAHSSKNNESDL
jgi:cytochrome c-type biogenesis protein CcmH